MKTCSIVNVVESSIARDSDFVLLFIAVQRLVWLQLKLFRANDGYLFVMFKNFIFKKNIKKSDYNKKIKNLDLLSEK